MGGKDVIASEAARRVREELAKPNPERGDIRDSSEFDPWEIFPCLYGSYSSDFDEMALVVLRDIRDGTHNGSDLSHHMFREILCTSNLCDYGTSPRVCFPTPEFREVLPELMARWETYAAMVWC